MPDDSGPVILTKLDNIQKDVTTIKADVKALDGTVQEHGKVIAVLNATALRIDAIKLSAIIGVAVVIVGALLKVSGLW